MSHYLSIIYDTNLGISVPEGMVRKRVQPTSATELQAATDTEAAMTYCRDEVLPELDVVDRDIVQPLMSLMEIIKLIQKTMVKRDHKLIDYDRHRVNLNKLNNKEDRSFSEEKQIFKVQTQLDTATQDYNYLNDMLKRELPQFFQLKASIMQPIFTNLYNMQARIYGMIYARCYELVNQNLDAFVTNTMGIEEGFNYRKQQRDVRSELEDLDLLKSGGKAWLVASGATHSSKLPLQERAALRQKEKMESVQYGNNDTKSSGYGHQTYGSYSNPTEPSPPPYYNNGADNSITLDSTPIDHNPKQSNHPGYNNQYDTSRSPQPAFNNQFGSSGGSPQFVIALYDYNAQAEGDLSFKKDDRIEIIEKTSDGNGWWTGRLNGLIGIFPGNYVTEI
ncbi:hypothetical protein BDB01DRAFT_843920 [Pilobolus umbonatus]|nr:hypothetical protein BDB01DRAFT_843920 [Pilobolus umbonatus]